MLGAVAEVPSVSNPRTAARRLSDFIGPCLSRALARQGFASVELVTRWPEIVGDEIAAHAEPLKISWPRRAAPDAGEPGTLMLRVEGPTAVEIQHLTGVIMERVNRFFGWRAIGRIALRQAPMAQRRKRVIVPPPSAEATARVAATLTGIDDDQLREALARLGAAVKRA